MQLAAPEGVRLCPASPMGSVCSWSASCSRVLTDLDRKMPRTGRFLSTSDDVATAVRVRRALRDQSAFNIRGRGGRRKADPHRAARPQKYTIGGTLLSAWGLPGSGEGRMSYPQGVAVDTAGNVYVADTGNHRIQKFSFSNVPVVPTTWGQLRSKYRLRP